MEGALFLRIFPRANHEEIEDLTSNVVKSVLKTFPVTEVQGQIT